MSLFVIGDLHLSLGDPEKSMEIFPGWENYQERIEKNWLETVGEQDTIVLAGDISWGMSLAKAQPDFAFIEKLPGKKILLKGNHDYWWTTLKKMREYLKENEFENIDFIYNNSYLFEDKIIVGTRGWQDDDNTQDKKILKRENIRLELSIKDGIEKYGEDKEIIVCMHYPPFNNYEENSLNLISTMKKYNVKTCIYGHLHGEAGKEAKQGEIKGINFKLVSCDQVKFELQKIYK